MQRNERKMLGAWVRYHGYLFGLENLYVLDNGSDDIAVNADLDAIERLGVNVIRNFNTKNDFDRKGDILSEMIRGWDSSDENYDFVITIDIDEFIFLRKNSFSTSRKEIHTYMDGLIGNKSTFILDKMLLNVPYSASLYVPYVVPKSIFAKGTLKTLDHGYHRPETIHGYPDMSVELGYFHLHHKNFDEVKSAALQKLAPYVDITNIEKIKNHTGAGHHLIKFFDMTEYEYAHMYDENVLFYAPQLSWELNFFGIDIKSFFNVKNSLIEKENFDKINREINVENNFVYLIREASGNGFFISSFCPRFYLEKQSDVAHSNVDPFFHFAHYGYFENRPWNEQSSGVSLSLQPDQDTIFIKDKTEFENLLQEDPLYFSKMHMSGH